MTYAGTPRGELLAAVTTAEADFTAAVDVMTMVMMTPGECRDVAEAAEARVAAATAAVREANEALDAYDTRWGW